MSHMMRTGGRQTRRMTTRRAALQRAATLGTSALIAGPFMGGRWESAGAEAAESGSVLQPHDAIGSILSAMDRFPLVALGERHLLQEAHDVFTALLRHPALPGKIDDIVVEFGNALYQDVVDRFVVRGLPVARADLAQVWRFTIGGEVIWDAPIYEQFFHTIRAVNWMLPPARRIRVLLGDPPFDHRKVRSDAEKGYVMAAQSARDAHFAGVVEQDVLRKGRRALLIAGSDHVLRGLRAHEGAQGMNAATRLVQRHPGALYIIDLLVLPPGPQQDPLLERARAAVAGWPRPAVASLTGTWLGATTQSVEPWVNSAAYLAATPSAVRYGAQADAILYVGPGEQLTASQADPSLYQSGAYAAELRRLSRAYTQAGYPTNYVADGLAHAQAGPGWFEQYGGASK